MSGITSRTGARRGFGGPAFKSRLALVMAATVLFSGIAGCSATRSVEAYCGVIAKHKDRYLSAMASVNSSNDLLNGLAGMVSALGDLGLMWEEAADVAPEEIRTDVEAVRDGWAKQLEAAEKMVSDPLAGLAGGILGSLTSAGAMTRVDQYTAQNCPDLGSMFVESPTGNGQGKGTPQTAPTSSPSASAFTDWVQAAPLTLLGSVGAYDRVYGNDDLLVTLESGGLRSFLPNGTPVGTYAGKTGDQSYGASGERLRIGSGLKVITDESGATHIYGLLVEDLPAQGLNAPRTAYSLVSLSPALAREWVVPLSTITEDEYPHVIHDSSDLMVEATTDGKAIVVLQSYVVPATKEVHNEKGVRLFPAGRFVVTGYFGADERRVIDPVTGDTVFAGPTSLERTAPADLIYKAAADGPSWRLYLDDATAVTWEGLLELPNGRPLGVPFKDEYGSGRFPSTPKVDPVSRTILNTSGTLGLDADTAEVRWQREDNGNFVLCAAGRGQALINAHHDQWVLIDAATGDQIDYLSGIKGCPDAIGTIGVSDGGEVYKLFDSRG